MSLVIKRHGIHAQIDSGLNRIFIKNLKSRSDNRDGSLILFVSISSGLNGGVVTNDSAAVVVAEGVNHTDAGSLLITKREDREHRSAALTILVVGFLELENGRIPSQFVNIDVDEVLF